MPCPMDREQTRWRRFTGSIEYMSRVGIGPLLSQAAMRIRLDFWLVISEPIENKRTGHQCIYPTE